MLWHDVLLPASITPPITTIQKSTQFQCTGSLLKFIENFQGRLEQGHDQWASTVDKRRAIQNLFQPAVPPAEEFDRRGRMSCQRERRSPPHAKFSAGHRSQLIIRMFLRPVQIVRGHSVGEPCRCTAVDKHCKYSDLGFLRRNSCCPMDR